MARRAARVVSPVISLVGWLYGRRAAGVDVALGLLATGWGALMVQSPATFDTDRYSGFAWLPDPAWIGLMGFLAGLHLLALLRPDWRNLRVAAALASAWLWMFVALSLGRVEIGPGVFNYGIVGVGALLSAIHVGLSTHEA